MDESSRKRELSEYRLQGARDSLQVAKNCLQNGFYKDAINRSYYSVFYAVKAVLALEGIDFKRHKDVIAYFNREYVAKEIFNREIGRRLGTLKQLREKSDYDDFYVVSREKAEEQIMTAENILREVEFYLERFENSGVTNR